MTGNLLNLETSPYLLQHQDNPVHWRPWGPDALAEAQRDNKPILLSVGYAACHWCHVMAHESFENPEIAEQMNRQFVNIKVDREERPDIDVIYQSALAMLGQQGGWPLTMFLTPDGAPFWGGTYFPPTDKWGRPGFPQVLSAIANTYARDPDRIRHNVDALGEGLAALAKPRPGEMVTAALADSCAERLLRSFDAEHGGIGDAPKFPQPPILRQLWAAGRRTGNDALRQAVLFTLRRMCEGGIYDHLGGGFSRYTVDREWLVPHFEKMLYDNAQLLELLALAWCDTRDPLFQRRAKETVHWLLTDMKMPEGAFASARDADSEGEEGRYYVWTEAEIDQLLGDSDDVEAFKSYYAITAAGNWEGKTILNRLHLTETPSASDEAKLAPMRDILLRHRAGRVPPLKDDKVLTDWNGMLIAALALAGRIFQKPDWVTTAEKAFTFIAGPMAEGDRLRHSYRAGQARHAATLDDYAAMIRAALALYEATGLVKYLDQAEIWAETIDHHYRDSAGAYFLTPDDAEALIARSKSGTDNATPSGNGVLVAQFTKLYWITGNQRYRDRAEEIIKTFAGELERNFYPYSNIIDGALFLQQGVQIAIVGPAKDAATEALIRVAREAPLTERLITHLEPGAYLPREHPLTGKGMVDDRPAAYLCTGPVCSLPITDPAALQDALSAH